jgi:hypothetical protein
MNLNRLVLLHVCADGTITYRTCLEPVFNNAALPFTSVNTVADAHMLITLFCKLQWEQHPQMPGKPWYRYVEFSGQLDDIEALTQRFETAYARILETRTSMSRQRERSIE